MGHPHYFGPSYMLETENDQSWNFAGNTYTHTDNMSIDGAKYTHCNHTPTGYSLLPHNLQFPNYQQDVAGPGPSNISTHTTSAYLAQASSSNYSRNPFNEEDLFDIRVGNSRVQSKRKSPGVPDGQSSSNVAMVNSTWQESQPINFLQAPRDYRTTNSIGLSIGGEIPYRSVRSRSTFDLETNTGFDLYTNSQTMDVSPSINLNPIHISPASHDNSSVSYELNSFLQGSSNSSSSIVTGPQNNNFAQSVRAIRSGYSQSQSQSQSQRLQLAANNYPPHPPRPSWHASDRRYRSLSRVNIHDRPPRQGLMIVDRSSSYGSRNSLDQHQDMRLDIDDMSYEELLALGERIGSVGTGLPDHLISKCIQESIYCSSDQIQDEGTCVICLEEYANMDDVGVLRVCRHDFHVGCIRKWLSMKNSCPVCKAEPVKQK